MDKFNFNKLVENPFLVKAEDVKSLQKIVELYPYCQPARILLTKAMHIAGHLDYEKMLNQTSSGMVERQKLKYWITSTGTKTVEFITEELDTIQEAEIPVTPKVYKSPDRTPPTADLLKSVEENLSTLRHTRNKAIGLEDELVTVPQVNIFEKILPFEQLPSPTPKEESKTEEIKTAAKRNRQQLPQGLINDFVKAEGVTNKDLLSNPFKPAAEQAEYFDYSAYKETRKAAKNKDQEKVDEIAKDFPSSTNTSTTGIESSSMGESISEQSEADILLNYLEHTKKTKRINPISKEKVNAILNKFIETEPSIKPAKNNPKTDNEVDLSQKSTRFQGIPASENFAELLTVQGKFSKAIEVFEELVLKYPEKKPYFAVRIEELKNKLNT